MTPAQKLSCFECLGVTYGPGGGANEDNAVINNGFGITMSLTDMDKLRDAVSLYLDNLSADVETKVAALVVQWDAVALLTGDISGGNVGNLGSVSYNPEAQRAQIRKMMETYVPVMHIENALQRRNPVNQTSIPILR